MATIAVLGTLDTKGAEHAFIAAEIRKRGHDALLIDVGTGATATVEPDITREEVAASAQVDLAAVMARKDRGECVSALAQAAPVLLQQLVAENRIQGVVSLGGGGGTAIATAAMRALPIGFPKLMISTLASGNTEHYVGTKDIVMMPSIVDVSGLNRISRTIFARGAGAVCGMVESEVSDADDKPIIVASMFGNTTQCVEEAKTILEQAGYEVLVFHSTGTGGRSMEALIESGLVAGVLDITATEWADELAGGVLSAGPHRHEAAGMAKIPAIVVPGCLDMVNFGEPDTVPSKYTGRTFYHHNPQVTLMRTNPEECAELGRILAEKINDYSAPVTVLLPLKAISIISAPGQSFHDSAADAALFKAIRENLRSDIPVVEQDVEINDPVFAKACAEALLRSTEGQAPS